MKPLAIRGLRAQILSALCPSDLAAASNSQPVSSRVVVVPMMIFSFRNVPRSRPSLGMDQADLNT